MSGRAIFVVASSVLISPAARGMAYPPVEAVYAVAVLATKAHGAYVAVTNVSNQNLFNLTFDCGFVLQDGRVERRDVTISILPKSSRVEIRSSINEVDRKASCKPTQETVARIPVPISYSPVTIP
jgi:hypothetical protein